jgi:hypothetical protein
MQTGRSQSERGKFMKRKKTQNLNLPIAKTRHFPNKPKPVDMSTWKDSPLHKASLKAQTDIVQKPLFDKKKMCSFRCERKCPGCGVIFSPDVRICPIEVFDAYKLVIDLDHDEYDILQRRREKDQCLYPGKENMGEA